MKDEVKISAETAEKEFLRWADAMDFELEIDDESDKAAFEGSKKRIVHAVEKGRCSVNDEGKLVYTVSKQSPEGYAGEDIVISRPNARGYIQGAKAKDGGVSVTLGIMSGMTGKDTGWFSNLALNDFNFFSAVAYFFLIS